jgi:hypothetical protein
MDTNLNKNPLTPLYGYMVSAGLDVSLYTSSLRQTALKIIQVNNLHSAPRNIHCIEDLILRLIDSSFILLIPDKASINYPMTFLFSRVIKNTLSSSFFHSKEIFLFHNDLFHAFSDYPPFPIHPLMKQERDQAIKFLNSTNDTPCFGLFSLFPIDQHYSSVQTEPLFTICPEMDHMVNVITNNI